jgi:predicted DNA-binding protein with PD1-like motif
MQVRRVARDPDLWILVLAPGEEVKETLTGFVRQEKILAASFVALGAFERATIGYFDWLKKDYQPIAIEEQVEVITLIGDIAEDDQGGPSLHAHTVLGRSDGTTRGGHLLKGLVRPTLEVTLTATPGHLRRRMHKAINVALIDPA